MNVRSRDWCFTINNYSDEDVSMVEDISSISVYLIYGKEVASTGTKHLQGYVYFKDAKSFSKMVKIFPKGTHIEVTKGTPQQASDYCKKEKDYKDFGIIPMSQGKRTDIEKVKELVSSGKGMKDVINVASSYQSIKTGEVLLKYLEKKRNFKPYVLWIHGESGSGKTRMAYELYPDLYRKTNSTGKWWDGYDADENILLDDIKDMSREFYSVLLELLDRYDCRVETKGGSRQFLGKNIVITSLWSPYQMYMNFDGAKELLRRIDEIKNLI